nr:EOG090X0IC1 [Eurycercus lamellatus]
MTLSVQLNKNVFDSNDCLEVHSIPCKIDFSGIANVSGFFTPYIESNKRSDAESEVLEASFRGHPLHGKVISIPEGYTGLVLNETKKPLTEVENRSLLVKEKFKELTIWNWDYLPTENDSIKQAMDWLLLSKVIHED